MTLPSRILVTGGRDFNDYDFICKVMDNYVPYFNFKFCIIHGGAKGVDLLVHKWAMSNGYPILRLDANWNYYNNSAGLIRNGWLLEHGKPDVLIAFPGFKGTANMIKQARQKQIIIQKVYYG